MFSVPSTPVSISQEGDSWDKLLVDVDNNPQEKTSPDVPLPASKVVDKIYASDRVAKFDNGQLVFGSVAVNRKTFDARIEWDDGYDENLNRDEKGAISLTYKLGIFDRKSIGYGSKVTNGSQTGTVREKRFLVTVALDKDPGFVLKDIPAESLQRSGYSKKDDKIVYNGEWIGLVVNTRAKLYFKMDKDGRMGKVSDEGYGMRFPHPGSKLKPIPLSHLWDAEWDSKSYWFWNLMKYLGDEATIRRAEIDCLTVAWMGRIGETLLEKGSETPPNILRQEEVSKKVKHLYGRNWKYIREFETWAYDVKEEDTLISYDKWVKEISEKVFFGLNDKSIDMEVAEEEPLQIESPAEIVEPHTRIYVKIVMWRTVFDVEWDDGTFGSVPSYTVKPYFPLSVIPYPEMVAGDIVKDKEELIETSKYGYILNLLDNGVVQVKWVTPNPHGGQPKVSVPCDVSRFDLELKSEYLYLRSLHNIPVVVCKGASVDGIKVGIAVGISVENTKIIVKSETGEERLVWAHDFVHFSGDIVKDPMHNKWVTWSDPGFLNYTEEDETPMEWNNNENSLQGPLSLPTEEDPICQRPQFFKAEEISPDNYFEDSDFVPRMFEEKFQNAVKQEIECFQKGIPYGIWIEIYSSRADVLTAAIQGPKGTPYEDHLLLFDIQLQHDFPYSPPDVCFHSFGLSVSPCLDSDGNVLMDEIIQKENEESSVILDCLNHIQRVILIAEPYELKRSDESEPSVEHRFALEYKNYVTLQMLEYTLRSIRSPPKSWESFIRSFYSRTLPIIINRYDEFIKENESHNSSGGEFATGYGAATERAFVLALQSRLNKLRPYCPVSTPTITNLNY